MIKKAILGMIVVLILISPSIAFSIEEGTLKPLSMPENLTGKISKLLSGNVWLKLENKGPFGKVRSSDANDDFRLQAPAAGLVPYREPSQKFSRTIIVSQDLGRFPFQNEPSIAVNPLDPDNVVIGAIDYQYFNMVAYSSIDGGVTWEGPKVMKPLQRDEFTSDPVVAFTRDGTAFYSYLTIRTEPVFVGNLVFFAETSGVAISTSKDGGFSWSDPILATNGDAFTEGRELGKSQIVIRFLDKPWMTTGPSPEDPKRDNIYLTYTEFLVKYPTLPEFPYIAAPLIEISIKLVASYDYGLSWTDPVLVSPLYSYLLGELNRPIVQGSMPVVDSKGRVYVGYYDSLDDGPFYGLFSPMIAWSDDGGKTFSKPVRVATMGELDFTIRPTLFRAWSSSFAYIATGPEDEVYYVFAANPPGPDESDIYFSRSLDRGKTWEKPKRVNDDISDRGQFFPFVAVDEEGVIHIAWGDKRDDLSDTRYHIYYTKSTNKGESFEVNSRVSDFPSNPMQSGIPEFIGDYFGIAARGGEVYIVWVDSRVGFAGYPNQDIAFARIKPTPAPTIFISPPSGPAGQMVTVRGSNFAPFFRQVYIMVDDVIVSSLFTDIKGRFTTTLFIPAIAEGPHTITAVDLTGNIATSSFYTEFGFNTIKSRLEEFSGAVQRVTESLEGMVTKALAEKKIEFDSSALLQRIDKVNEDLSLNLKNINRDVNLQIENINAQLSLIITIASLALALSVISLLMLFRRR
ncbi:MAG: sialidase family protein [Nitrososphaerales archaeon]